MSKWDDLRLVLAIASAGTLAGAGRALGLSHATVYRRIGEVEARFGVKLFERGRTGYVPTPAGEEVAAMARRIETQVLDVERRVAGRDLRPSGTVRVTTTDTLLFGLLSPLFTAFRQAHPEISLEVAVSNQLFNLSKREADVAVRPSSDPPETLVGRKIATIAQAVYGRRPPGRAKAQAADLQAADWVGSDERMAYRQLDRWMAVQGHDARCRYRVDTLLGMLAAVRAGAGLAVLPCYLCDRDQGLIRHGETLPPLASDLWLLTHHDLRKVARIRTFLDFLAREVKGLRGLLTGEVR